MSNGSWIGAIGMLTRNEVDLIAAELMMATDRLEDVEYTTPVYTTKFVKTCKFLDLNINMKIFSAPIFDFGTNFQVSNLHKEAFFHCC